jgi:uncharacterized protein
MKHFFLIAGIAILLISCSTSKPVNFEQLQDRGGLFYMANEKEPFTGDVISYQAGRPVLEGHIKNGLRDGLWIFYYSNGQKQAEGNYADGLKEGNWNYWKDNGEQEVQEVYKMGSKLGNTTSTVADTAPVQQDPAKPVTSTKQSKPVKTEEPAVEPKTEEPAPVKAKEPEKPKPVVWEKLRGGPIKYLDDVPYTGDVVKYFNTGGMELQGHFTDGRRTGKWTFYWPNGTVKDVRYY